jgi:hypothetical protein
MTTARRELVDINVTRWYHCISRCVRAASLMGQRYPERKQWIEDRLELLTRNFAIGVGSFSIMDNHLHVLVRLEPERVQDVSAEDVVRRWLAIYPPRTLAIDQPKVVDRWVAQQVQDRGRVELIRGRLQNLGWFMKALKEPLSRLANKQDGARGTFWEARYKSIAILDPQALLASSVYIDLNPVAAGLASTPERSGHTSLRQRVEHARAEGKLGVLKAARAGSVVASKAAGTLEQGHWLIPIEDRRPGVGGQSAPGEGDSVRPGMLPSLSLGSYLQLVDYVGRLYRTGKGRLSDNLQEVFDRLDTGPQSWTESLQGMLGSRDLRGSFFAADRTRLRELSARRGKRLANLTPQQATV